MRDLLAIGTLALALSACAPPAAALDGGAAAQSAPRPADVRAISVDGLTPLGPAQAPVEIVMYADYQCPVCGRAFAAIERIVDEMPGMVVLYFKNYPLSTHPRAVEEAAAALAADNQGKYWDMSRLLFAGKGEFTDAQLRELALRLDLDMDAFDLDRRDGATRDRIAADKAEAVGWGVVMTPGVFVNGKLYRGAKTYPKLKDRVEAELETLGLAVER